MPPSPASFRLERVPKSAASIMLRGLGATSMTNVDFTQRQIQIEQSITLTAAAVSLCFGLVTFYWFVRMRRNFRHHLIMLLILSDMFKALWYLIFPLVSFTLGPVKNSSEFCKATGFFVSFGFEASDFAILMIAVHATLYIFRPHASVEEAGLYSYRYLAYACWIVFPALMASLAFINQVNPYVSQGTFCYLPVRPFWYRLALAWIPRYLIILTITLLYLAIYVYVKVQFRDFDNASKDSYKSPTQDSQGVVHEPARLTSILDTIATPSMPSSPISPSFPKTNAPLNAPQSETGSFPESRKNPSNRASIAVAPSWENYSFGGPTPLVSTAPNSLETYPNLTLSEAHFSAAVPIHQSHQIRRTERNLTISSIDSYTATALRGGRISSSAPMLQNTGQASHDTLDGANTSRDTADDALQASPTYPILERSSLFNRHTAIKRQLRFLFIYPLVYMLMWTVPFANHCLQYSDYYSRNPPYLLNCFATTLLALQCAVDCLLFSTREKPWQFIGTRSGFWSSFKVWDENGGFWGGQRRAGGPRSMHMPGEGGKTRGEMLAEARLARERRDLERERMRDRREMDERRRRESLARRGGQDRSWWEVEGRRRADSVLLGTDTVGVVAEGKKVEVIAEEGEGEAEKEEEEAEKEKMLNCEEKVVKHEEKEEVNQEKEGSGGALE